ncbi:MAG: hypothetical protein JST75_21595 [Bacteroidetes bacterium]|nr:hypothetical protein [Bacteroidota bacterium]
MLTDSISIEQFREKIGDEVERYKSNYKKKGISNPIYLTEDIQFAMQEKDMDRLDEMVRLSKLSTFEASYIADALLLSNNVIFESDQIMDRLEYLVASDSP